MLQYGFVAQIEIELHFPFPQTDLCQGYRDGCSEMGKAIE